MSYYSTFARGLQFITGLVIPTIESKFLAIAANLSELMLRWKTVAAYKLCVQLSQSKERTLVAD
jgi:hypothetical protein